MSAKSIALRVAALGGMALIAGCAPQIEGRLYMQDLAEVAESGEPIIMPADLRIPESTEEECNKGLADLALKLNKITPVSSDGECVEIDNSQFSQFTIDLPLVAENSVLEGTYLAVMTVMPVADKTGSGLALNLGMNRTLEDVQDAIGRGENNGFSISTDDQDHPAFIFAIENDARDPIEIMPNFVFVDGEPGLPGEIEPATLDRRESVEIVFSDVVAAHVAKAGDFTFASVYPAR